MKLIFNSNSLKLRIFKFIHHNIKSDKDKEYKFHMLPVYYAINQVEIKEIELDSPNL